MATSGCSCSVGLSGGGGGHCRGGAFMVTSPLSHFLQKETKVLIFSFSGTRLISCGCIERKLMGRSRHGGVSRDKKLESQDNVGTKFEVRLCKICLSSDSNEFQIFWRSKTRGS